MSTLTYMTKDGKNQIDIDVIRNDGAVQINTYINGKHDWTAFELTKVSKGDIVARVGHVCLTQERADYVQAVIDQLNAELDADLAVQLDRLIAQRDKLSFDLGCIQAAAHEEHVDRVNRGYDTNAPRRDYAAEEYAAKDALAQFDGAHPDVIETINARKTADNQRFLARD